MVWRRVAAARVLVLWASVVVWGLTGCGGDGGEDGGEDGAAPEPMLVLGTGEAEYEELADGERLQLAAGSQGGYHVWLSFRAQGLSGPRMQLELELVPEGPAEPAVSKVSGIGFDEVEGLGAGWLEHVGWPARILDPWCAVEQPVLVRVTLTETAGEERSASAETEIVPTAPRSGFGGVRCEADL